jgi:dipeptidyl aminopeptidase/acylaminoacyl peptidase
LERIFGEDVEGDLSAMSVTWSPQGDLLLVTFTEAGILAIPVDGDPSVHVPGDTAANFAGAAWSPAGDALAFMAAAADADEGARQLMVAPVTDGAVDPATFVVASRAGDGVSAFSWLPDGSGLVYAESGAVGGTAGGDLFTVQSDGSEPRLIASAGRAAPVAQIVDFAVSPDGSSLAYTIATPDANGERLVFHSLWVRALDGNATVPVPIPGNEAVTQLWWTAEGLVWRSQPVRFGDATPDADQAFAIERLDSQSTQHVLFTATPEATPVASPEASPASPEATPEPAQGTPDAGASPVAGAAHPVDRG